MCGETSLPPLAIAADTMAICNGVAVTSNCPMPVSAVCDLSMSEGYTLGYARTGTSCFSSLKPNFSAIALTLSCPRSTAIFPNTLLQEYWRATRIVAFSQGAFGFSFVSSRLVPGNGYGSGLSVRSSTDPYSPSSRAAAATTSLNVEPGGSGCRIARLTSGLSASLVSLVQVSPSLAPVIVDGSYDGVDTMARILPVFGSMATAAPFLSPSAEYAAFCTSGSIVVITFPGVACSLVTVSMTVVSLLSEPSSTFL